MLDNLYFFDHSRWGTISFQHFFNGLLDSCELFLVKLIVFVVAVTEALHGIFAEKFVGLQTHHGSRILAGELIRAKSTLNLFYSWRNVASIDSHCYRIFQWHLLLRFIRTFVALFATFFTIWVMIEDVFFWVLFSSVKNTSIAFWFYICRLTVGSIPISFLLSLLFFLNLIYDFGLYHLIIASIGNYGF
mgnify:CR=1 FL=1